MAVIGAFIVFAVFLFGQAPVIYVADSPLFSTASFYLSSAQPPGYPLFITLGKLFTFIPFGSIAFRVGLLGAVSVSMAWLVLFKLLKRMTGNGALAFSFSFLPVFLPLVYQNSVEQKGVYTLNTFFGLLILYLGVRAWEEDDVRLLYMTAFLFGLGSGNHHTLALFLFPALVPFWMVAIGKKRWRALPWSALFFAGGFLIYLHLYLRSLVLPGKAFIMSIAANWNKFLYVFFRKTYNTSTLGSLEHLGKSHMAAYLSGAENVIKYVIAAQYGPVMTGVFFISFFYLLFSREKKAVKAYFLLAVLPWLILLPEMAFSGNPGETSIQIVRPYYLPVLFLAALVMGLAANRLWLWLKGKNLRTLRAAQVFLLLPLLYLPGTLKCSLARNFIAYDHAKDTLSVLPSGSILLVYGDNPAFGDFYMQWVERYREDVLSLNKVPTDKDYIIAGRSSYLFNKNLFEGLVNPDRAGDGELKTGAELNALCREGRIFTVHPNAVTQTLKARYEIPGFYGPLSFMLLEKGAPTGPAAAFLLKNYSKLNYERAASEYSSDYFVEEIKNLYGYSLLWASTLSKNREEKAQLAGEAMKLVNPRIFIPNTVAQMAEAGRTGNDALLFLRRVETNWPDTGMARAAHVMEYILLSESKSPGTNAEYEYLREHGLLVYLPGMRAFYRQVKPHG